MDRWMKEWITGSNFVQCAIRGYHSPSIIIAFGNFTEIDQTANGQCIQIEIILRCATQCTLQMFGGIAKNHLRDIVHIVHLYRLVEGLATHKHTGKIDQCHFYADRRWDHQMLRQWIQIETEWCVLLVVNATIVRKEAEAPSGTGHIRIFGRIDRWPVGTTQFLCYIANGPHLIDYVAICVHGGGWLVVLLVYNSGWVFREIWMMLCAVSLWCCCARLCLLLLSEIIDIDDSKTTLFTSNVWIYSLHKPIQHYKSNDTSSRM